MIAWSDAYEVMEKVLDGAIQYTAMRFQMDEGLMATHGDPRRLRRASPFFVRGFR